MPTIVEELRRLPAGAHCLSLHTTQVEAAGHAASFLSGTPEGQAARYWVPDPALAEQYRAAARESAPARVDCVAVLRGEQVAPLEGKLRPVAEVRDFLAQHPEGVSGAAETITRYWAPESIPAHLEYEAWLDSQPREHSRFLCPYDLRQIPPELGPGVLRGLGARHSHLALSGSRELGVRLLQLFAFPTIAEMPTALHPTLGWAVQRGLVELHTASRELSLTVAGERLVRDWSRRVALDGWS